MKTNHLNKAADYIDKSIDKLRLEQADIVDEIRKLTEKHELLDSQHAVIEEQIQSLFRSKKSLGITDNGAGDDYPVIDLNK